MARSKQKVDLDAVIEGMDFKTLLQLAVQNRNKKHSYSFLEYFKQRNEDEIAKTVNGLTKLLIFCMEKFLKLNGNANWEQTKPEDCNTVCQIIQVAVDIGLVSLQLNVSSHCLVELALLLNGILPEIPQSQDIVKNSISQYCEKLYATSSFDRCEYFLFNVLAYLLQRTLSKKPTKIDVKRIYSLRKMIGPILDMKECPKEKLWNLVKMCAIKNVYVSFLEGQKVIGLLMALDIDKVSEIHQIIRNHLPTVSIKIAIGYGRVYFEAWCYSIKIGRMDIKNVIEITCLQDFILLAIRTQHRPFLPLVRKLLAQFHHHKKELEVAKMLYCLYQPLLWRFLKNPDGQIRANATQLFLDIFPLEDPDVKVVATDLELNDQLLMIRDLLLDDFPIVRITAVLGICVSMSVNWEVFPEEMLKTYFRIIVDDLSRDSSCSEVRCAVVKGMICLLENPLTMRCLVSILPKLQGLFHDISENVRIAFCQLLLRVKKISAIKYFHIVPIKHLFARLEEDCHAVKKAITNLLSNSYFPKQEDPKVWMGRCLEIIRNERTASRVFFTYVGAFIGLQNTIAFMVQAIKSVHFYVKTKQNSTHIELSNKENIVNYKDYLLSLEQAVGFNNMDTVSSLMDAIAAMWLSMKVDLEQSENKFLLKMMVAKIGKPLSDLCLYYKDTEAWESVFFLSSFLPPAVVPSLASLCFWRLKNMPPDAKPNDYMTLLECLCNHRQGLELVLLLKDWIETGLNDSYVPPPAKRRKKRGKNEKAYHDQPKPYLANKILNSMLCHRGLQKAILQHGDILQEMLGYIDHIKRKLERFNARMISEHEAAFLGLLMKNIIQLSVFLHNEKFSDDIVYVNEIVQWADKKLVRHLTFTVEETTDHFTNLIFSISKNLCQVISDTTALGFCKPTNEINLIFFEKLLHSGLGYKFAYIAAKFLYKHAAVGQFYYLVENNTTMLTILLKHLIKVFNCFCNETLLESISHSEFKEIQYAFASLMQIVHNHVALLHEPASAVFQCILKNILESVLTKTALFVEDLSDENFDVMTFPQVGAFFMSIMLLKPALLSTYIKFLNEHYQKSEIDISLWISFWAVIYRLLDSKALSKFTLKEAHALIQNLEKTVHELYPRKTDSQATENPSPEATESVPAMVFQRHCHSEFLKLKSRLFSKLCAQRNIKN